MNQVNVTRKNMSLVIPEPKTLGCCNFISTFVSLHLNKKKKRQNIKILLKKISRRLKGIDEDDPST